MVHIIAKVRRLNEKSIDSGSKPTLCQMSGLTSCVPIGITVVLIGLL